MWLADLVLHDEVGSLGWQAGLHVERDGTWEVSLPLPHLPSPLLLPRVQQPLEVGRVQVLQLRVALQTKCCNGCNGSTMSV